MFYGGTSEIQRNVIADRLLKASTRGRFDSEGFDFADYRRYSGNGSVYV